MSFNIPLNHWNSSDCDLAKRFQRRSCRNRSIRNKNCLWRPYLYTNRSEMNNLYRQPSIYVSYQVSVHLVKRFQRRRFLEIDQSKTRIACGGHIFFSESGRNGQTLLRTFHKFFLPSFGLFDQVVSEGIEDFFLEKSTYQKQLSVADMFINGSRRNEQSL